jgi:hypothetical protein
MPIWKQPLHAEGAAFVGHDRHDARADRLVAQQRRQDAHEGHGGGEFAPLGGRLQQRLEGGERRNFQRRTDAAARGQRTAERGAALAQVFHLRAVFGKPHERDFGDLRVGDRDAEAVAEGLQGVFADMLLLMGDHLPLARLAHAIALDGLGENDGRLALVVDRGLVGGVDLDRIMAAALQRPDLVVAPVGDHRRRLGIAVEEILADVSSVLGLEVLIIAVDAFLHHLAQPSRAVHGEQRVPVGAPKTLDDVPAGAAETGLEFLHDLAVAAHRPVEALQIAVDDENEVVELLAARQRNRAERFRLVHLAVAAERPDLAPGRIGDAAALEIAQEPRLIDRHQRPEPHRNRGKLPEVGHQPGMRIGRKPLAANFLTEIDELFLAEAPFEKRARVDSGRGVPLEIDEVAAVGLVGGAPEMHEAGVVEGRRRLEAGDVAAELGRFLVGAQHDRRRVPADVAADGPFEFAHAGMHGLVCDADGVEIGGIGRERQFGALAAGRHDNGVEQLVDALQAFERLDRVERIEPFPRLRRVALRVVAHRASLMPLAPISSASAPRFSLTAPAPWQC